MPSPIFQTLHRIVRSWWLRDRIRVSPLEGRFLRIKPGAILVIGGIEAEVVSRSVTGTNLNSVICLNCETAAGSGELQFDITTASGPASILWKYAGECHSLDPDDIEVWRNENSHVRATQ